MGRLCIIRHGETDWNKLTKLQGREDIDLNKTGLEQARVVGEYLKKCDWEKIISSPLKRALNTARTIGEVVGIKNIHIEQNLIERDYGKASGMTLAERVKTYPDKNYEGMEDWYHLRERVLKKVMALAQKYDDKDIIIISHGAAINSLLYTLSNGQYGSGITKLHMCSVSMLNYEDKMLKVNDYNRNVLLA